MHTVLLIDDDNALLEALDRIFSASTSCRVEIANNGFEGINLFNAGSFDLVITDIRMPGIDGRYVARYISHASDGAVPVVGMSGTPELLSTEWFDAVLEKPFDTVDLKRVLRSFGIFL